MLSWIEKASQPRERRQGTSTRRICPSIRAGVGNLAEGEPLRLLFQFRGGPNYGGSKFGMTGQVNPLTFIYHYSGFCIITLKHSCDSFSNDVRNWYMCYMHEQDIGVVTATYFQHRNGVTSKES